MPRLVETEDLFVIFFVLVLLLYFDRLFFCCLWLLWLRFFLFYGDWDRDWSFSIFRRCLWNAYNSSHHRVTKLNFPFEIFLQFHDALSRDFSLYLSAVLFLRQILFFDWLERLASIWWRFWLVENNFVWYFELSWLCLRGKWLDERGLLTALGFPHTFQILEIRHIKLLY